MKDNLLTVVVPCYNVEQYIDKCISSIIVQTYHNLEILLVNDGSSDIAQCGVFIVCNDGRIERYEKELKTENLEVLERKAGVLMIIDDKKWRSWMWNKIFKKTISNQIIITYEYCYFWKI